MKTVFKLFLGFFVLVTTGAMIAGGAFFWWASQQFVKPSSVDTPIEITVARGANIGGIADQLLYAGAIDNTLLFKAAGRVTGQASTLKAGEYEIPAYASMKNVLDLLESGKVVQRQVTVREGLTNWEIKNLLDSHEGLLESKHDYLMKPEGFYLPETYSYKSGDTPYDILKRMNVALENVLDKTWAGRVDGLPLKTREEALVLASIIEKETAVSDERRRVAGVFINRLNRGIPLQTDPTVIYALTLGKHKNEGKGPLGRRLLKKDLKFDSPYNTYLHSGLPPGPIANAGKASIEAALNPEEHDYIYFVADGTGGHAFARTLAEHNRNVANWRKIRKSK